MKKYFLSFLIIASSIYANELSWVDEQVNAIKPNRVGTTDKSISKIKNPFVYLKKNSPKDSNSKKSSNVSKPQSQIPTTNYSSSSTTSKKSKSTKLNVPFKLSAIINSSALIEGNWYKLGDKVKKYKIIEIGKDSIKVSRFNKIAILKIKHSNKLKFK